MNVYASVYYSHHPLIRCFSKLLSWLATENYSDRKEVREKTLQFYFDTISDFITNSIASTKRLLIKTNCMKIKLVQLWKLVTWNMNKVPRSPFERGNRVVNGPLVVLISEYLMLSSPATYL